MGPPLQENSLTTAEIGLRPEFTYKAPAKKDDQKLHGWVWLVQNYQVGVTNFFSQIS